MMNGIYKMSLVFVISMLIAGNASSAPAQSIERLNELGPVKVVTMLEPDSPTIGDQIQLTIQVSYPENVEVLMPEFGEALSRYTILDFVPRKKIEGDQVTETQKYTLQPYLSGEQSITPILIEFIDNRPGNQPAPDDADAYEILTDRIDFVVQSVLPKETGNELKPLLGELQPPTEMTPTSIIGFVITGLVAVGLLIAGLVWFRQKRKKVIRRSAYEIARRKLDRLLSSGLPQGESEVEHFFVSISSIVRKYLEDRFDLQAPDLTTEEFLELASSSRELTKDHQKLLRGFLNQADLVKFAGIKAGETEITNSRDAAVRFLEDTRENAPLIDDPAETKASNDDQKEAANV